MAKDPAFLFYSSDFLTGVSDLTMEERGQYITLLCLQHQKGELTKKTIDISVPNLSKDVLLKFEKSDNGNYKNNKLYETISERTAYAKHQKFKAYLTNCIIKLKKECNANQKMITKFKDFINSKNIDYAGFEAKEFKKTFDNLYNDFANAQRTPLEDVNEIEIENKDRIIEELIYPFDSENFKKYWNIWKQYKKEEHKFNYKSNITEQAALKKIGEVSKNNESQALKIIENSIANGYKGFFEIKENTKGGKISDDYKQSIIDRLENA